MNFPVGVKKKSIWNKGIHSPVQLKNLAELRVVIYWEYYLDGTKNQLDSDKITH
jgi:hypothetical protein